MNIYAQYDSRRLKEHLSDDDDTFIIEPRDNNCVTRKKSGISRHIIIHGVCVLCDGITDDELESRREQAAYNARWSE